MDDTGQPRERTRLERTPDGRRLVVSRRVVPSAAAVWRAFRDTRRWPEWGPSITAVDCETRYIEAGTTGRIRAVGGLRLPFEITSCADGRWTWRVARVPATGHQVRKTPDGTVAAFEVPVLAAGYVPVCRRALRRLERVAESESVPPG
jgi:hypothetical protein